MADTEKVLIEYDSEGLDEVAKEQTKLADLYEQLSKAVAAQDKELQKSLKTQVEQQKLSIQRAKTLREVAESVEKYKAREAAAIVATEKAQAKAAAAQATVIPVIHKTADAHDKVTTSSTKLATRLSKLQGFARDLRGVGGFLGNDTLMALGSWADGLSDIGGSIDTLTAKGNKLGKILGFGGAAIGGVGLGASIYDATIGQLQGTNTATILDQMRQLIEAGFNTDTIYIQAKQAYMQAQEGKQFSELQRGISEIGESRLDLLTKAGIYTGKRDEESMRAALKMTEEYLKTAPEWKPAAPGEKEQINYKLQAEIIAAGLREELQRLDFIEAAKKTTQERNTITDDLTRAMLQKDQIEREESDKRALAMFNATVARRERESTAGERYKTALLSIESDTQQRRAEIVKNYSQSLLQLDQAYYAQRQQVAEQYGVETARMEADHQKNIRRMQEDHQGRLKKLIESRDALAVEDEIDSFNQERQRAEEDYQELAQERQQDFARQLRDMERAHQEQRNERQRAYQEQLRDLNVQAQQRRQQEAAQYALLLKEIMQAFIDARNEFAAAVNNSTTVTNNTKNANVTNNIKTNANVDDIKGAVYSAISEAFR